MGCLVLRSANCVNYISMTLIEPDTMQNYQHNALKPPEVFKSLSNKTD